MPFFSSKNKNKKVKLDLTETDREKRRRKMGKTVDPTRAITEEEPWAVAQHAAKGISQLKHKDLYGNDIMDPDRSNPTRNRMERPLETIKSFERAIYRDIEEKEYGSRRSRYNNGEPHAAQRSSMAYAHGDQVQRQSGYDNASVYSQSQQRQPSNLRQSNHDQYQGPTSRNREVPSTSDTNSGSYNSNGWSADPYSTNPSSDASGYMNREFEQQQQQERLANGQKPLPPVGRQYSGDGMQGQNGYNNQAGYQQSGYNSQPQQQQYGSYNNNAQYAQPNANQYRPSGLNQQPGYSSQQQSAWNAQPAASKTLTKSSVGSVNKADGGKRKSWFKRSKA